MKSLSLLNFSGFLNLFLYKHLILTRQEIHWSSELQFAGLMCLFALINDINALNIKDKNCIKEVMQRTPLFTVQKQSRCSLSIMAVQKRRWFYMTHKNKLYCRDFTFSLNEIHVNISPLKMVD